MEGGMAHPARTALVLQGGGALGAYELGAARRVYKDEGFAPDVIAGVSIGAITAVLLARPATGLKPLEALEAFWQKITVSGLFLPPPFRPYASVLGNPNFFVPRLDYYALPAWTNIYDTEPLRQTLSQLVDLKALADPKTAPGLLVSATDVEAGEIAYFYSHDTGLSLDHIIASGSLPPSFPMTAIGAINSTGTEDCSTIRRSAPCSTDSMARRAQTGPSMSSICFRIRRRSPGICRRSRRGPKTCSSPTSPWKT
jgi:NTE family protein